MIWSKNLISFYLKFSFFNLLVHFIDCAMPATGFHSLCILVSPSTYDAFPVSQFFCFYSSLPHLLSFEHFFFLSSQCRPCIISLTHQRHITRPDDYYRRFGENSPDIHWSSGSEDSICPWGTPQSSLQHSWELRCVPWCIAGPCMCIRTRWVDLVFDKGLYSILAPVLIGGQRMLINVHSRFRLFC
jgi:hypothetical protein